VTPFPAGETVELARVVLVAAEIVASSGETVAAAACSVGTTYGNRVQNNMFHPQRGN